MGKKSRRARARARAKARTERSAGGELVRSMPAERIYPAESKLEPKSKAAMPPAGPARMPPDQRTAPAQEEKRVRSQFSAATWLRV